MYLCVHDGALNSTVAREALVRQLGDMKREAATAAEALHKHKEAAGAMVYTHAHTTRALQRARHADALQARLRAAKADVASEAAAAVEARRQAADTGAQLRAAAEARAALERQVQAAQHDAAMAARALQVC